MKYVQSLADVDTRQLLCMRGGFGHEWEDISKPRKEGQWGYRFHANCARCGKERTTIFNIYGVEASHFYKVPGWHVAINEPFTTADVRLEVVRRMRKEGKSHLSVA